MSNPCPDCGADVGAYAHGSSEDHSLDALLCTVQLVAEALVDRGPWAGVIGPSSCSDVLRRALDIFEP